MPFAAAHMAAIGTFLPCQPRRVMPAIGGRPADILLNASSSHFDPLRSSAAWSCCSANWAPSPISVGAISCS